MPYLTPDEIPETDDCRSLLIPASSDWLAIVSGALTELTLKWNWEQFGSVTVDQAVERMQTMIDGYYEGCSDNCELPEGGAIIRVRPDGELEELIGGEWVEPEGDYIIPPPAAREGGTVQDQKCLAAANATNVLNLLYEELSEAWGENLSTAEALTSFTTILVGAVGFAFAPITAAIAAFMFVVFEILYTALEYLGADLWDEDFNDQMECFLYECASNADGVVTFDWECFTGKLNSLANDFLLNELQMRLYLQVSYMIYFIGGVDGLNLAGGTTDVETADCDDCEQQWCFNWDFELTDGTAEGWYAIFGEWQSGVGYVGTFVPPDNPKAVYIENDTAIPSFSAFTMTYLKTGGSGTNDVNRMEVYNSGGALNINSDNSNSALPQEKGILDDYPSVTALIAQMNAGTTGGAFEVVIKRISVHGYGTNPFGESNC